MHETLVCCVSFVWDCWRLATRSSHLHCLGDDVVSTSGQFRPRIELSSTSCLEWVDALRALVHLLIPEIRTPLGVRKRSRSAALHASLCKSGLGQPPLWRPSSGAELATVSPRTHSMTGTPQCPIGSLQILTVFSKPRILTTHRS